jgi:formylglycine-generating enzyme required for sulfatase activity
MMELVRPQSPASRRSGHSDLVWIPGGTFRMGSDRHYAEEAPVHRVTVDGFWIDRSPVTNRPAARHPEPVDTSTSHVGFRCIIRQAGAAP